MVRITKHISPKITHCFSIFASGVHREERVKLMCKNFLWISKKYSFHIKTENCERPLRTHTLPLTNLFTLFYCFSKDTPSPAAVAMDTPPVPGKLEPQTSRN